MTGRITRGEEAMATAPLSGPRLDLSLGLEAGRGFKAIRL